jgi:hypothetical protein
MKSLDKGMSWVCEPNKIIVGCFDAEYCMRYIARNSIATDECNSVPAGDFRMRILR